MIRINSTPEKITILEQKMVHRLCRRTIGGITQTGIVHRVYAAKTYDGIRCLIAWDSMHGNNPIFQRLDVREVEVY